MRFSTGYTYIDSQCRESSWGKIIDKKKELNHKDLIYLSLTSHCAINYHRKVIATKYPYGNNGAH